MYFVVLTSCNGVDVPPMIIDSSCDKKTAVYSAETMADEKDGHGYITQQPAAHLLEEYQREVLDHIMHDCDAVDELTSIIDDCTSQATKDRSNASAWAAYQRDKGLI